MTDNDKTYRPEGDEDALAFVRRVVNMQSDREPLRIVETLVEIAVTELKDRPCDITAEVSDKRMKVTLRHSGHQIDSRMIRVMSDFTDRVEYHPDGDDAWQLVIRRDIPPLFATRR
jgi:hypothetical protein